MENIVGLSANKSTICLYSTGIVIFDLSDFSFFMSFKIVKSRCNRKPSLLYSIKDDHFKEYAVPSHSLCSLYFNKKALFISDDENRVFVVTLYNSEIQIKDWCRF